MPETEQFTMKNAFRSLWFWRLGGPKARGHPSVPCLMESAIGITQVREWKGRLVGRKEAGARQGGANYPGS